MIKISFKDINLKKFDNPSMIKFFGGKDHDHQFIPIIINYQ